MVQEFHVVRCFSCESFQVQQVKKVNRWCCKVCGEKQSLLKEFGRGSGADCRRHVQKLNAMRGEVIEKQEHDTWSLWEQVKADGEEEPEEGDDQVRQTQVSRWSKYLDASEEAEQEEAPEEDSILMDRQQLHGNNMTDRKRKGTDTPSQSSSSSLIRNPARPSATTRTISLTYTSPPSLNQSSLTCASPPSKKRINPPSLSTAPGSKWTWLLNSDCQVEKGDKPSVSGQSQPMDSATSLSCGVITRPRPLLPGSSLFETEEEFNFDDEDFLTDQKV
ncbi:MRN complex-interacting protein [Trachinotus anak]|uniref:MRN complex-interacting protein n=1 Tax=Trachinotus anak TaxID=443729 RepID=UPI0039F19446